MNPVIFLDIDGVLNHSGEAFETYNIQLNPPYGRWVDAEFSTDNIRCWNKLIKDIGQDNVDIVISSAWRKIFELDTLMFIFEQMNIKGNIVGVTPDLIKDMNCKGRGDEIHKYVQKNGVDKFVVIDDYDDMVHDYIFKRFVQTSFNDKKNGGLQRKHIERIKQLLGE